MRTAGLPQAPRLCGDLSVLPDAALVRMHAAQRHIAKGRKDAAKKQLALALVFWRSVGATRFIEEAEALGAGLETATTESSPHATPDSTKTPSR